LWAIESEELTSYEHAELAWLKPQELLELDWADNGSKLLDI
jgi:hypothetical protein